MVNERALKRLLEDLVEWISDLEDSIADNYFAAQDADYGEYFYDLEAIEALKKRIREL